MEKISKKETMILLFLSFLRFAETGRGMGVMWEDKTWTSNIGFGENHHHNCYDLLCLQGKN